MVPDAAAALGATIDRLQPTDVVFIADENTARYCLPLLGDHLVGRLEITVAPGEPNKTLATCHTVWSALMRHGLDRHGLIVNVGGGVVTDLGGFCAATWKRGVRFVQVPTSLLAMVDAAVGGKTGVNLHGAKNQVGVFADPADVLIDPGFLKTLPRRHRIAGLAEMIKHGLIADPAHLRDVLAVDVENWPDAGAAHAIARSVDIKRSIVADDPLEAGWRAVLNLGHTAGHALESMALDAGDDLLHGEAVAWGLLAELHLSGPALRPAMDRVRDWVRTNDLPRPVVDRAAVLHHLRQDKKNRAGQVRCVVLEAVGRPVIDRPVAPEALADALEHVLQNT